MGTISRAATMCCAFTKAFSNGCSFVSVSVLMLKPKAISPNASSVNRPESHMLPQRARTEEIDEYSTMKLPLVTFNDQDAVTYAVD
ncbi:unnamed protein product [Peronospora belbahrii]|uniref:Uncharacterized protein n=1 Tax=Peronospora belbahrii TaxID=622444 RepID=A0ABN8CRD4_9STRA|nr:unnamed protein product [Peronospora belbahrii]